MQNNQDTPVITGNSQPAQTGTDPQAANAARAAVTHVYNSSRPGEGSSTQTTVPGVYNKTHQETFDWRNYHTAWQQYYQQYYNQYYSQQLQEEKQKITGGNEPQAGIGSGPASGDDPATIRKQKVARLKENITSTVKTHAQKARHSHHFIPIISAVGVGLVFLFLQFNSVMVAQIKAYVSPGAISGDSLIIGANTTVNVGPEPKLIIPKINVEVPIDYSVNDLAESQIQESLRDGATHYKLPGADAIPGQFGNTVILGHSSNDIFNQGKYKFVFVLLDRLQPGDTFYLNYNSKRYIYKVTEIKTIKPTEVSALQIGTGKPMATLVTCTPPGTALNRLLIIGEQISPEPGAPTAENQQPTQPATNQNSTIPGNEPSWLDNLWSFFF